MSSSVYTGVHHTAPCDVYTSVQHAPPLMCYKMNAVYASASIAGNHSDSVADISVVVW